MSFTHIDFLWSLHLTGFDRDLTSHAGTTSFFSLPVSRGVIFTRARVSLALLSLRKNGGLLVV